MEPRERAHDARIALCASTSRNTSYIVIGWLTPDYRAWAERFAESLRQHGEPYDLIEVEKDRRGWEATTRMKPAIVLRFMEKYPGKPLILSDVDALAAGDLSPLAAISADIALRFQWKRLRGRNMVIARSGTMVLKPSSRPLGHRLINRIQIRAAANLARAR